MCRPWMTHGASPPDWVRYIRNPDPVVHFGHPPVGMELGHHYREQGTEPFQDPDSTILSVLIYQ